MGTMNQEPTESREEVVVNSGDPCTPPDASDPVVLPHWVDDVTDREAMAAIITELCERLDTKAKTLHRMAGERATKAGFVSMVTLDGKAEGVRLAMSFVEEIRRDIDGAIEMAKAKQETGEWSADQ